MRAGTLNKVIAIRGLTETQNDFGEVVEGYTTKVATRSSVEPMTAKEKFVSNMPFTEQYYKFTMRFVPDIKESDSILYNNDNYSIVSICNIKEQQRELEIIAQKIKGN